MVNLSNKLINEKKQEKYYDLVPIYSRLPNITKKRRKMSNESTLVLIKPDGVNRALIGKVIDRLESTGLKIIGMKLILIDKDLASKHYEEHKDKAFFF